MSTLTHNAKAQHDFDILQTFEGGLVLTGAEVKSVKSGNTSIKGAFLSLTGGELFLKNVHIGHYPPAGKKETVTPNHDHKVLIHKKELNVLRGRSQAERLTIVPISLYTARGLVKISFGLARGKRKWEKRASIKKRDLDRAIRRNLE